MTSLGTVEGDRYDWVPVLIDRECCLAELNDAGNGIVIDNRERCRPLCADACTTTRIDQPQCDRFRGFISGVVQDGNRNGLRGFTGSKSNRDGVVEEILACSCCSILKKYGDSSCG